MRITFLTPADTLSGGTRVIAIYARKLQERGHDVFIVSSAPDRRKGWEKAKAMIKGTWQEEKRENKKGHISMCGVPHKALDIPGPITADDVPDADIIIATWWETAVWMDGMPASKGRKAHLIQGIETWAQPHAPELIFNALKLPNIKIAISSNLKQAVEENIGKSSIHVIPNAIDPDLFNAPPRERQANPTVGFLYSKAHYKGADICATACQKARNRIPNLQIIAFGRDKPSTEIPLPDKTRYFLRPPQEEIRKIYSSCDIWLLGSRIDSFGLPILEAMACRTPVISVSIGAATDLLGDGTGTVVKQESAEEMAQAIIDTVGLSENEWKKRSERAHEKAHDYTWDDAVDRMLELLSETAENR